MRRALTSIIRLYQRTLSPDHGARSFFSGANRCRHVPTCSEYASEAIERFGVVRGSALAAKRVLGCHSFSTKEAYDPVPERNET